MANVKTSTSGRRYVEIDEVIERRLEQIRKSQDGGNGDHRKSSGEASREDRSTSSKTAPDQKERSLPAA